MINKIVFLALVPLAFAATRTSPPSGCKVVTKSPASGQYSTVCCTQNTSSLRKIKSKFTLLQYSSNLRLTRCLHLRRRPNVSSYIPGHTPSKFIFRPELHCWPFMDRPPIRLRTHPILWQLRKAEVRMMWLITILPPRSELSLSDWRYITSTSPTREVGEFC